MPGAEKMTSLHGGHFQACFQAQHLQDQVMSPLRVLYASIKNDPKKLFSQKVIPCMSHVAPHCSHHSPHTSLENVWQNLFRCDSVKNFFAPLRRKILEGRGGLNRETVCYLVRFSPMHSPPPHSGVLRSLIWQLFSVIVLS